MKLSKAALLLTLSLASFSAFAGPAADNLGTCMTDNTTGKERKEMARWIFVAMSAHPELKDISNVTPEVRDGASKNMAKLVTRLVTETCVTQARAAGAEGSNALVSAFGALGKVAMQELMSDPGVNGATQDFLRFVDKQKFEAALRPH